MENSPSSFLACSDYIFEKTADRQERNHQRLDEKTSKFIQAEALLPQWGQYFFVKEDLFWGRKIISLVAVGKPMILAELISVTVGARGKIYA